MQFFDTHCHIHEATSGYDGDTETRHRWDKHDRTIDQMVQDAHGAGVTRMLCVGTTRKDSEAAITFVAHQENMWASIGIHPHEAALHLKDEAGLAAFARLASAKKVVAVGECGLDYFYEHSPKADQVKILEFQLDIAQRHNLPLIFHVRDAFDDFWPIFDNFKGLRGVIHSFTATPRELEQILQRDLYVGLNGIMTFTKNADQLEAAKAVPLDRLLLETDAPFLTPVPFRGKICEPKHVVITSEFLSKLRGEFIGKLGQNTTRNAQTLFNV
jgi:TatD DNase family protein